MIRNSRACSAIQSHLRRSCGQKRFGSAAGGFVGHNAGAAPACGFTHPRRKQYHVVGFNYEQGGPLIQKWPTGIRASMVGSLNGVYNICPPGLGKEGKWDYDGYFAFMAPLLVMHILWWVLTLLPGGPVVGYKFGEVKGRHPNNPEPEH